MTQYLCSSKVTKARYIILRILDTGIVSEKQRTIMFLAFIIQYFVHIFQLTFILVRMF